MECTGRPTQLVEKLGKIGELHFEFFESLNFGEKSVYLQVILDHSWAETKEQFISLVAGLMTQHGFNG